MARNALEAHNRIDIVEPKITKLETENHIQFKEVFYRLKRLEVFLVGGLGATIAMLVSILLKMG